MKNNADRKTRKLTQEECEQRLRNLEDASQKRRNDPELVKLKVWIKEMFKSEDEPLCEFAAVNALMVKKLNEENEKFAKNLNDIYAASNALSDSNLDPKFREFFAKERLAVDKDNPSVLAFTSGLTASKKIHAANNAGKRHANNRKVKNDAFLWFDSINALNMEINEIAELLVKKEPVAFSTAQKYVREWKKQNSPKE